MRFADSRCALPHWRNAFWMVYSDDVLLRAAGEFGRCTKAEPGRVEDN